eukprot:7089482-Prymnesium_polylepis.1
MQVYVNAWSGKQVLEGPGHARSRGRADHVEAGRREEQRRARTRQHKCDLKRVTDELVKLANLCAFNADKRA